jgi:hypothetical protein
LSRRFKLDILTAQCALFGDESRHAALDYPLDELQASQRTRLVSRSAATGTHMRLL